MIKQIKEVQCSYCGCTKIEAERRDHKHTNGSWNEYREFQCGRKLHFSPNFMGCRVESECTASPLYKQVVDSRDAALNKVQNYIKRIKVDVGYKETLLSKLEYVSTTYPSIDLKKMFPEEYV